MHDVHYVAFCCAAAAALRQGAHVIAGLISPSLVSEKLCEVGTLHMLTFNALDVVLLMLSVFCQVLHVQLCT
jgi:hypothetical protein